VTNHRHVLEDSDLLFPQHFEKIVRRFDRRTPLNATMKSPSRMPACPAGEFGSNLLRTESEIGALHFSETNELIRDRLR
jgi:hypothetical protein